MILLDCGNSKVKAQYRHEGELRASFASRYNPGWPVRLAQWLSGFPARQCHLVSVLDPQRQAELMQCLEPAFGESVIRHRSEPSTFGLRNGYLQPERLGADRWVALIAAAELVAGDCIVIVAGSAITLDLLRGDGQHLGGAILPGLNTSLEQFRRIFSTIDFDHPEIAQTDQPGCSTEAAIQIDYRHDAIEILPDLVNRWRERYMPGATILLAGGDADRVQRELASASRILPDLVFRGLYRLARQ